MLILRVLGGSRLYGTAGPGSDWDYVEVHDRVPGRRASQTIEGDVDILRFGLTRFLVLCDSGFPRALEAMFAPDVAAQIDLMREYRHAFVANVSAATATYSTVIERFLADGGDRKRRHAVRLAANLDELRRRGRFDPVRNPEGTDFDAIRWPEPS